MALLSPDSPWRRFDWPYFLPILGLAIISLIVLYSAGERDAGLVLGQSARMSIAFGAFFLAAAIPPRLFALLAPYLYAGTLLLLVLVPLIGSSGMGAQRWIELGPVTIQPSEIMKLVLPMALAAFLSHQDYPPKPTVLAACLAIILLPTGLVMMQPDLGTSVLIGASGLVILFLAGAHWGYFAGLAALVLAALPPAWYMLHDYQRQRVLGFLNPEADPHGSGYHIIQSKIAIGSGGMTGKGWLNGTQAQLDFLPERHTDFIFAVLSEEFGLIGGVALLSLYLLLTMRGLVIAFRSRDIYSRLVAGGISTIFFFYVVINIGMTTGLMPVVGVPLPLVSFGGSSLLALLGGLGLVMGVSMRRGR
ncbi:rod shape-determining protein RodA [Thiohalorhabdus denitrificans]|uniref:Peptidoglycan glycosyltransferase MrdB n=1 Tax=Thiohalorhabdus denitrificans TaxID=381306 RepID=A0A0N8PN64_9GAMM|nr:rod shape-determining protein RodA [Thiohalorhabdus denitrificans]KPV40653.1 rod shape-determining protein RodA [Thiohalorhabdus denitrificans]SCY48131.1 cell elongation-specific peptidoglycan biosynthesis regulator RodA [Thiohalorhabdus denitrificans]